LKWLHQHPPQLLILLGTIILKTDCHTEMAVFWLIPIGTKHSIPPRQVKTKIAIGFLTDD
jgi:hypothetical protein